MTKFGPWLLLPVTAIAVAAFALPSTASQSGVKSAVAVSPGAVRMKPPANGELGFIVSTFAPAILPGMEENCPAGYANSTRENYLQTISRGERERLLKPENEVELTERWKRDSTGPDNTNICSNYDQFPQRPLQKTIQSRVADGLDLDGGKKGSTCSHQEFTGPDGSPGIDNQAYRVFGCTRIWRAPDGGPGETEQTFKNYLIRGEYSMVMLVRGIQSFENDDSVEVILATTTDLPVVSGQDFVSGATYRVSDNHRWRNVLPARIRSGVLTTQTRDILLSRPNYSGGSRARRGEWDFSRARLRIHFSDDGTFSGVLGGYQTISSLIHPQAHYGTGTAHIVNLDCASQYNTLRRLADGGKDPRTGQCNRVSSGWTIMGVQAFVTDPGARIIAP